MDKKLIAGKIEEVFTELTEVLSSFNESEINTLPFEGSWTAGQVAEHLIKSYGVVETLHGSVTATERAPDLKVKELEEVFLNFDIKMNSPEFILPSQNQHNKHRLIDEIAGRKADFLEAAVTLDLGASCLDFVVPGLEVLTRFEWLSFVVVHTRRHIHQLRHIRAVLSGPAAH